MPSAEVALLYLVFTCLFGMIIGSFLNVVIYRTPRVLLAGWSEELETESSEEIPASWGSRFVWACRYLFTDLYLSLTYLLRDFWVELRQVIQGISFPESRCGSCEQAIRWHDNLPVLSWLILRGKCRHCQTAYSIRYPFVELSTGLLFVGMSYLHGFSYALFFWFFLASALWAIFWIDLDTQFIFNVMTYPSILMGILYNSTQDNLKWSLIGGLLAWVLFESIIFLSIWLLQKEGMGGGDVKLAILIGVWLGPTKLLVALAMAFVLGTLTGLSLLLIKRQSQPFPFGPFLVIGALVSMAVGEQLWSWYINKSIS